MEGDGICNTGLSCSQKLQKTINFLARILFLRHKCKNKDKYSYSKTTLRILKVKPVVTEELSSDHEKGTSEEPKPINSAKGDFLNLPLLVRKKIYDHLEPEDVLALRMTSSSFKRDVEIHHGVCFRLHDGRLEFDQVLLSLGIKKLIVENFTQENSSIRDYFPYPELLKSIVVAGPISATNFRFILRVNPNLRTFVINFQSPDMAIAFQEINWNEMSLVNLKVLELSSSISAIVESSSISRCIRAILKNLECSNLISFEFNLSAIIPQRIRSYHNWTKIFILRNSRMLKNVKVEIKQLIGPFIGEMRDEEDDIEVRNEWISNNGPISLERLHLSVNTNLNLWYPVIDAQTRLRCLTLDMKNQSWTRLILVFGKCVRYLKHLSILGILSFTRDETSVLPVDFGFLQNLKQLETLEVHHEITDARGLNPPIVLRTSLLPQTLKSVKLTQLRLKPHQAMFLLMKLPNIQNVELESWTDSETTLAGFLAILTFVIKFEQTPATSFTFTDSRRKMENQEGTILKMKNLLQNKASVIQNNFELYSKLVINCFKFN